MGNGNCKQCKCNNCVNEEKNMTENIFDKNLEVIKNDAYESFDNEFKNIKREINKEIENENLSKIIQIQKNENEKNTTNNNIDNITDNKKEKTEFENINSMNNIDKKETINNINNYNDKILKEEITENNHSKKYNYEEDINFQDNIHISNINIQKHKNNDDIKLKISKDRNNKSKVKVNKTRNNNDEFNENNNDLVYITNKNKNVCENFESNNSMRENKHYLNNNIVNYIKKYAFNLNDDNNENEDKDNIYKKSNDMVEKNTNILFEVNKSLNIFNIISKNKLVNLKDNSILCNSILEKIIKIPEKSKIIYNERFCVLTKKNFSYYKSKESYLNLGKPLLLIDLKNIIKVEQTILDETSYYFGLICMINDETKKYVDKINSFINAGENNKEEFLLGFRSKNKDLIIKWIVILNYFVENYEY